MPAHSVNIPLPVAAISLGQRYYPTIFQHARMRFIYFITLRLVLNMLEVGKQVVSACANNANKHISVVDSYFIETVIGLELDRLSFQMNSNNSP